MDLTKNYPRSPKEKMLGIVSLARTIDKARAYKEGKLGEYDYDCPHDRPVFQFLGTDGETFAAKVAELGTEERIAEWVQREFLSKKTPEEIEAFNRDRHAWHPDPGSHSEAYFNKSRAELGRPDVVTWFDLLDLDEKREVREPARI